MSDTTETSSTTAESSEELEGSNVAPDPPEDDADETDGPAAPPEPIDEETRGMPGQLSRQGADFIGRFEGVVLHLYNDPTNNATIGVGHLVHMGPIHGNEPAEFRHGITRQRAIQLLQHDAGKATAAVHRQIRVPLKQHQLDALTSFVFNVGEGSLQNSTLRRRLNAGKYAAVPNELDKWVFSQGKKLPGLVRRRKAEGNLFAHGRYA
jgi:lysozyme